MSASLEYRARRALRSVAARIGTPPVSVALLVLAVAYTALALAWSQRGSGEAGQRVAGSLAFEVLAAALGIDAIASLFRAVPQPDGAGARRWPSAGEWGRILVRAAYLLLAAAFLASMLSHEELTMRLAAGERAIGAPEQLVSSTPARPYAMGPFPVAFGVVSVSGALRPDGGTDGLAVRIRSPDGEERTIRRWAPLWVGFGRLLVPSRAGHAVRYAIAVENGGVLESGVAKLDLLPAGRSDEFRCEAVPHRIVYRIPPASDATARGAPLEATVFRSRLLVAEGRLDAGGQLRFDGLVLTAPEVLPWAEIVMIRDPGVGIAALALVVAAAGGLALLVARRSRRASAQLQGGAGPA